MAFNASIVFFFTSSTSANHFPLSTFFIQGNKKKSHRARSGEYGRWRSWVMPFWLKIVSLSRLCALARCRGAATTTYFATTRGVLVSPRQGNVSELVGKTPG
jgi:hypothetical protein